MEIDHELISTVILLSSADSRRVVVSYKQKCVHDLLVNCLVKLSQEKKCDMVSCLSGVTIAVDWDLKKQTKSNHKLSM